MAIGIGRPTVLGVAFLLAAGLVFGAAHPAGAGTPDPVPSRASGSSGALDGVLSELRAGVFAHDRGPFSSDKEGGVDGNLEFLFTAPEVLDPIWSPRPTLGATINSQGDTSQAYLGLTWEWEFWRDAFVDFSFGGALHNGELKEVSRDQKALGCALLFREGLDIGWRFAGGHSLMAHLDHISNANLCDNNEGLDNLGIRYGYRF